MVNAIEVGADALTLDNPQWLLYVQKELFSRGATMPLLLPAFDE